MSKVTSKALTLAENINYFVFDILETTIISMKFYHKQENKFSFLHIFNSHAQYVRVLIIICYCSLVGHCMSLESGIRHYQESIITTRVKSGITMSQPLPQEWSQASP